MAVAYVGLGSNLDDPCAQLERALTELDTLPATHLTACSPLYRSAPVGVTEQPDFINAVAALHTTLTPHELLTALLTVEQAHGRVRALRWGPRTLDLDLLLYDDLILTDATLTLPHPRLHERAFVLYPLADLAPALTLPGHGPLRALLAACPPTGIERLAGR